MNCIVHKWDSHGWCSHMYVGCLRLVLGALCMIRQVSVGKWTTLRSCWHEGWIERRPMHFKWPQQPMPKIEWAFKKSTERTKHSRIGATPFTSKTLLSRSQQHLQSSSRNAQRMHCIDGAVIIERESVKLECFSTEIVQLFWMLFTRLMRGESIRNNRKQMDQNQFPSQALSISFAEISFELQCIGRNISMCFTSASRWRHIHRQPKLLHKADEPTPGARTNRFRNHQ